jgi:hypothetical protein
MLEDLVKLANHLDSKGLYKEADALDAIIKEAGIWETLGFRSKVEPEESPFDKALKRYNNQIQIIDAQIRDLNSAGYDISEDNENEKKKAKLVEKRREILEQKKRFMANYHYMKIN